MTESRDRERPMRWGLHTACAIGAFVVLAVLWFVVLGWIERTLRGFMGG